MSCTRHGWIDSEPCFECAQERKRMKLLLPGQRLKSAPLTDDFSISKLYPRGRLTFGAAVAFYCTILATIVLFWGLVFDGFSIFR